MTNRRLLIGVVASVVAVCGCDGLTDASADVELRTSRSEYIPGSDVAVSIANPTDESVFVAHCNQRVSLMLQRRVNGAWQDHRQLNGPLCVAIYPMGELAIPAGSKFDETVRIDETGEFRLQVYVRRAHEDFGSLVVVSQAFRMQYPPD